MSGEDSLDPVSKFNKTIVLKPNSFFLLETSNILCLSFKYFGNGAPKMVMIVRDLGDYNATTFGGHFQRSLRGTIF